MVALARLTHWNLVWEMRLNVALAGLMLLVLGLHSGTLRTTAVRPLPIVPCYSLLVFSLVQYQNWLMGPTFFLNVLSAVVALVLLSRSGLPVGALCGAAVSGVISSYSMGNGLLVWPLGVALIGLVPGATKRRRIAAAALWLGVAILTAISYFLPTRRLSLLGHAIAPSARARGPALLRNVRTALSWSAVDI